MGTYWRSRAFLVIKDYSFDLVKDNTVDTTAMFKSDEAVDYLAKKIGKIAF
jgi:hypothetical protein